MAAEKKAAPVAKKAQISLETLQSEIRDYAQVVFNERAKKGVHGDALSDWLKAEKEVKAKHGIK